MSLTLCVSPSLIPSLLFVFVSLSSCLLAPPADSFCVCCLCFFIASSLSLSPSVSVRPSVLSLSSWDVSLSVCLSLSLFSLLVPLCYPRDRGTERQKGAAEETEGERKKAACPAESLRDCYYRKRMGSSNGDRDISRAANPLSVSLSAMIHKNPAVSVSLCLSFSVSTVAVCFQVSLPVSVSHSVFLCLSFLFLCLV